MSASIADIDAAVNRLNMPVVELDRNTWRTVIADRDAANSRAAVADLHLRERQQAHARTAARADELAAQLAQTVAALRNLLGDPTNPAHRATAAGLLHQATATTRNPR